MSPKKKTLNNSQMDPSTLSPFPLHGGMEVTPHLPHTPTMVEWGETSSPFTMLCWISTLHQLAMSDWLKLLKTSFRVKSHSMYIFMAVPLGLSIEPEPSTRLAQHPTTMPSHLNRSLIPGEIKPMTWTLMHTS